MSNKFKVNLFGLITVLFWGASYPGTKIALAGFSSPELSLIRCVVAAALLTVIGIINHQLRRPATKDLPLFILCGIGFGGYLITYSQGLATVASSTSSLIVAMTPILTAIYAGIFWRETIRPLGWVSILCAFGGVALLLVSGSGVSVSAGIWWTFGAAVLFALYNLTSRKLVLAGYSSAQTLVICIWLAALMLSVNGPSALASISGAPGSALLAALFLGFFPSGISYWLWNTALGIAERTNDVTNYCFVTPLFSTLLGVALIAELPSLTTILGGLVIIGSMVAFNKLK